MKELDAIASMSRFGDIVLQIAKMEEMEWMFDRESGKMDLQISPKERKNHQIVKMD